MEPALSELVPHVSGLSEHGVKEPGLSEPGLSVPYLGYIVLVEPSFQTDPGLGLEVGHFLHHLQDISHLLDRNHQRSR